MKFFNNCKTLSEVKNTYRDLAKKHHPDVGGSTELMQEINSEYTYAIAYVARNFEKKKFWKDMKETYRSYSEEEVYAEILRAKEYKDALDKIIRFDDIKIELIGTWLWVTGSTKKYKDILKEANFKWAKKKTDITAWFFRTEDQKSAGRGMPLEKIRSLYGSQKINSQTDEKLY